MKKQKSFKSLPKRIDFSLRHKKKYNHKFILGVAMKMRFILLKIWWILFIIHVLAFLINYVT